MNNSNSISLDTPYKNVLRLLLSSTFNTKQTALLIMQLKVHCSLLTKEEYTQLIDISKNGYKLRVAPLILAIFALHYNKLENPKQQLESLLTQANLLTTSLDIYNTINGHIKPLAAPLKKALATKLTQLSSYDLIKGNTPVNSFKLIDVIKLTHPKPISKEQEVLFKQILENDTPSLDNWETVISGCKTLIEKQMQWERLLLDKKLNNLSLLRNLNNMVSNQVNKVLVVQAILNIDLNKVNLFQLLNATLNVKEKYVLEAIQELINTKTEVSLKGNNLIILDTSGSMEFNIDSNGINPRTRLTIATMLAYFLGRLSEQHTLVFTAGSDGRNTGAHHIYTKDMNSVTYNQFVADTKQMPSIIGGGGIFTRQCLEWCKENVDGTFDRTVVISDSEDSDRNNRVSVPFTPYSYLLDISRNNGNIVFNKNWTAEINGWSENLPKFIQDYELSF